MNHQVKSAPYRNRRTWPIGVRELGGWRLKVYGICADGRELTTPTIDAALAFAENNVPWPEQESRFGFATLHFGEHAVWLLVDLWVDDILRHFLFRAPLDHPEQFAPGPADGTMACVWELNVLNHERSSWIEHVLSRPEQPDYQVYLQDFIEIDRDPG